MLPHSLLSWFIEGSLEVKLPTIWTDGKAEVGRVREEKRRRTNYNYDYNYATLHYTTLDYLGTTLLYITLHYTHYTTTNATATTLYTLITLHHNYNSTTLQLQLQLHYTTLHPAVVGDVTDQVTSATIVTTQKNTTPTTFQSISGFALPSVIHNDQALL